MRHWGMNGREQGCSRYYEERPPGTDLPRRMRFGEAQKAVVFWRRSSEGVYCHGLEFVEAVVGRAKSRIIFC